MDPLPASGAGPEAPQTGLGEPDTLHPEVAAAVQSTARHAIEQGLK